MGEKKVNKKILIPSIIGGIALVGIIIMIIVMVVGKDDDKKPASGTDTEPTPTVTVAPTSTPTPTPTPTPVEPLENMGSSNPLNIDGYVYYEDDAAVNEAGDVYLKAEISGGAMIGDYYLTGIQLFECNENEALFTYTVSNQKPRYNFNLEGEYDDDYDYDYESVEYYTTLLKLNANTLGTKEMVIDYNTQYVNYVNGSILLYDSVEETHTAKKYDGDFRYLDTMVWKDYSGMAVSYDTERYYYVDMGKVTCSDLEGNVNEVPLQGNFEVNYISGVITAEGRDHIAMSCKAGNLKSYNLIVDAETGEVEYAGTSTDSYTTIDKNVYVETIFDTETYVTNQWIVAYEGKCLDFLDTKGELDCTPNFYITNDGNILFYVLDEDKMYLSLYSGETAELVDSTVFPVESSEDMWGDNSLMLSSAFVCDDSLLLYMSDYAGDFYFYQWKVDEVPGTDAILEGSEHVMGSRPAVEIPDGIDLEYYSPKELSEELLPLREKADELEKKFEIEIYIGEECADVIGGYAIEPLTDYATVDEALDVLDRELSKYPEGFLPQLLPDYLDEEAFYLASSLMGVWEGTLGFAGGFQTEEAGKMLIVLDCSYPEGVADTIHHEICHSIDDYMISLSWETGIDYLGEPWEALNPVSNEGDSCYTYDYGQWGYGANSEYTYETIFFGDGDVSNVYFIDSYAMTYPTEDRARIFENVMSEYSYVDFDMAPHLKAKLDYYVECIRKTFDTTGWDEQVAWEKY
ncbi:MAG: hypothetical protein ACI39R_07195 [Lachnospiraceae bacterium]